MKVIGYLVIAVLVILGVTFAVLNAVPVTVNYYFATAHLALSLLLAISFAVGVLIGIAVLLMSLLRLRFLNRRLRRQVQKYKKEIETIRLQAQEDNDE